MRTPYDHQSTDLKVWVRIGHIILVIFRQFLDKVATVRVKFVTEAFFSGTALLWDSDGFGTVLVRSGKLLVCLPSIWHVRNNFRCNIIWSSTECLGVFTGSINIFFTHSKISNFYMTVRIKHNIIKFEIPKIRVVHPMELILQFLQNIIVLTCKQ